MQRSQIFASSYPIGIFTPCVYQTLAHYLAACLFWLSILASFTRARRERKREREKGGKEKERARETVSSLLTCTCHRGPLGVYSLP